MSQSRDLREVNIDDIVAENKKSIEIALAEHDKIIQLSDDFINELNEFRKSAEKNNFGPQHLFSFSQKNDADNTQESVAAYQSKKIK